MPFVAQIFGLYCIVPYRIKLGNATQIFRNSIITNKGKIWLNTKLR